MKTLLAKTAAGGTALAAASAGTFGLKNSSLSNLFQTTTEETGWNRIAITFEESFKDLRPTEEDNYDKLTEEGKKWWKIRFSTFWANKSKIRSKRFDELVVKNNKFDVEDPKIQHWEYQTVRQKWMFEEIERAEKIEVQQFIRDFYKECKDISQFIFGKKSDENHWRRRAEKFLEPSTKTDKTEIQKEQEEKLARYFRDAWVACSNEGSTVGGKIVKDWPYRQEIEANEDPNTGRWRNLTDKL
ncbi:hypothetical protein [Candidatus Mycoplasma haematohominis]|uniref:hypothetical protein n=1 Tax=Candidatus Mycoplasma haematohominis TaxID=1494318 RepID=UPI001C0A6B8B|nr:hypothetical protein [Candidatus Mycoplasma haemohominis]